MDKGTRDSMETREKRKGNEELDKQKLSMKLSPLIAHFPFIKLEKRKERSSAI